MVGRCTSWFFLELCALPVSSFFYWFCVASICLGCTLWVWLVLLRFGLYFFGLACTLPVGPVLYRLGLYSIGLACTVTVWRVLYRFLPVLFRLGLYSIGLG